MTSIYPDGPSAVPPDLTKPTGSYKLKAWLAMAGLAVFVLLYLFLSGWFLRQAWRLMGGALRSGGVWPFLFGMTSALLAVFMLKAVFFVKHGRQNDGLEVTAKDEPQLFAFLYRLADEAGAPRPHRVFLSGRVNAAVFYDLSILNFLWPTRKNLEIGLALVNVLNLSEFKAVLAHEFGHFAQGTMAVGRWVYVAQQIAGHIVAKRGALDRFLQGLSRADIRFAWVGWILSLIVWSIRSLLDTAFRLVLLAQRALSREMEMQADLVSVSLTGSDALVNALHRLAAADEAWGRSLAFVNAETREGRMTPDFFAIQTRMLEHLRLVRNDPSYGLEPQKPEGKPETHRVFRAEMAQPPQMWSTHPLNHERETNAKRIYLPAPSDPRSAWSIFQDAPELAVRLSAHLAKESKGGQMVTTEEALKALDREFQKPYFDPAYRGVYLGRSVVRIAKSVADLYEAPGELSSQAFEALYPQSLGADLERLQALGKERDILKALSKGTMTTMDGVIRHRGQQISPRGLPEALHQVEVEIAEIEDRLCAHDRRCRSLHRAAAASLGRGWESYLMGLAALLHYADHSLANLRDAYGAYRDVLAVETAARKVGRAGANRIVAWANTLHGVINGIHMQRNILRPGSSVLAGMKTGSWSEYLGKIELPSAGLDNINQWVKVVDGWTQGIDNRLSGLRDAVLAELLVAEAKIAEAYRAGSIDADAPDAGEVPRNYAVLVPGSERKRESTLRWWTRFQIADGPVALTARLAAAGAIVVAVLSFGAKTGRANLTIYNGLSQPVSIVIDGQRATVAPFGNVSLDIDADGQGKVQSSTEEGQIIEAFQVPLDGALTHYVYNVASASPMVIWTATYGNRKPAPPKSQGALRWGGCRVDIYFAEPPHTINSKNGGGELTVLSGMGERSPQEILGEIPDPADQVKVIGAHARWDGPGSPYLLQWLALAGKQNGFQELIAIRLKDHPYDVATLRSEQDAAEGEAHAQVAARDAALAQQHSDNPDLQYVAARAMPDKAARDLAFLAGEQRWPEHPWFAFAAAYVHTQKSEWDQAIKGFECARRIEPALREMSNLEIARIRRLQGHSNVEDLANQSYALRAMIAMESGKGVEQSPLFAFADLQRGDLDVALSRAKGDPTLTDRMLRFVAGSDGAREAVVRQALILPVARGLDQDTACVMLALSLKHNAETSSFRKAILDGGREDAVTLIAVANSLASGKGPEGVEPQLRTLDLEGRGRAYMMGLILMGKRAPQSWRDGARRLLFASERPYFAP